MDVFFKKEEEKYAVVLKKLQQSHDEMTLPMDLETDMVECLGMSYNVLRMTCKCLEGNF